MKPVYEKVPRPRGRSFASYIVRGTDFGTPWHIHPELELTLTLRARGHRIVGDNIASLVPGDLVFLGPNVPHVWQSDPARSLGHESVYAVVIQFREDCFGAGFFETPELAPVRSLFARSSLGLKIGRHTAADVAPDVEALVTQSGPRSVISLLSILTRIAACPESETISSPGFMPSLDEYDEERVNQVCQYINDNLAEPISRKELADLTHFSEGAFSRFFKTRTGKTLPTFINELRVGRACRLLNEDELSITEIAFQCGFTNLSNFNRQFLRLKGTTPRDYRKMVQGRN